ncbi:MAG: aminotransferase class V-fold PLP-dependent enzyme [Clostridia bacterium]|nr:aminotransferase class V-fold PLP-dependent enzyme [Clostridia bacterium]
MNVHELRKEIIGNQTKIQTPFGERVITYADYTASGKSLKFIEKYMIELQKVYANSHTEESMTGKTMTEIVHLAERNIKKAFNALDEDYIIPVGTGATGAIQKLASILGIYYSPRLKEKVEKHLSQRESLICTNDCVDHFFKDIDMKKPVIFISAYEHHSNDLIWRESFADVVEINLTCEGLFDLKDLEAKVSDPKYKDRLKVGSISAASNVTGVKSPIYDIARILHEHDAYACFDFAASAPYVDINMNKDEKSYFDAIYVSSHKFIGGPGATGLLVINKRLYDENGSPTIAGGGTVDYVSSLGYDFVHDVEAREMAGTPGILQIIKASLAIELKDHIGIENIESIEEKYITYAFNRLLTHEKVHVLGPHDPKERISIMSFNIRHKEGYLHHKFVTKLLNDLFGIQSRAGCACAGPYGHRLLDVDAEHSMRYRDVVLKGYSSLKPGWVRVNFHYAMSLEEVAFIVDAIEFIGKYGYLFIQEYIMNLRNGMWEKKDYHEVNEFVENFGLKSSLSLLEKDVFDESDLNHHELYREYMEMAHAKALQLEETYTPCEGHFEASELDDLRWYPVASMI